MRLIAEWQQLAGTPVYAARPAAAGEPLPVVIVIQEIWGVDEHIRDLVERFAAAGYQALAPDLYAREGRRAAALTDERLQALKRFLDGAPPAVWRDAAARESALRALPDTAAAMLRETMDIVLRAERPFGAWLEVLRNVAVAAREEAFCNGRVMCSGYCMGGHLSALLAGAERDIAAAAIYYGTSPGMDAMKELHGALIGFYGGEDRRVTDTVPELERGLREAGKRFEVHVYPGAPHAFFNDTRPSYRIDAARDAWARTLALFASVAG